MENTLVIIKPDGVRRGLTGKILSIFESKGMTLTYMKLVTPTEYQIRAHYDKFVTKDFFPRILKFMTSGPVVVFIVNGYNAIAYTRKLIGSTNPIDNDYTTIRGMFATGIEENIIHASENITEFKKEYKIWVFHATENKNIKIW